MLPLLFYEKKLSVKNFAISTRKQLLKQTLKQMFSCGYWEISKNTYLEEHLNAAASKVN